MWQAGRYQFERHPEIAGAELFEHVVQLAEAEGFVVGGPLAGHLVGEFPHKKIAGDDVHAYLVPGSTSPVRRLDRSGRSCHWILEVHLVNADRGFGGFYEELLDLP